MKRKAAVKTKQVYVPVDLVDALRELDKQISEHDRSEMIGLDSADDMIQYHRDIGMSIRNDWGLWERSRLQIYFASRGAYFPDEISSIILYHYWHWLRGDTAKWKEFDLKQNLDG